METRTVLVVDDEALIAMLNADTLEIAGHHVILAYDGREALEKLNAERADLVITDYMMPRMDGLQLARAIRADPTLSAIPIVLVSAVPGGVLANNPGLFNTFLQKPYMPDRLLKEVTKLLGEAPTS